MTVTTRRLLCVAAIVSCAAFAVVTYSIDAPLWYEVLEMPAEEAAYWATVKVTGMGLAVLAGFAAYQLYRSFRPLDDGVDHDGDGDDTPDSGGGGARRPLPAEAYGN